MAVPVHSKLNGEGLFFQRKIQSKEKNATGLLPVAADLCHLPIGLQPWQTLQTQGQFQLQLPPGKMCSADYAGLLPAFQVFILDELMARGFCQIQVCAWLSQQVETCTELRATSRFK